MSVKIRKEAGAWWVFICYHGKRKAKKVGTREAAERVKCKIEARLALGDFGILEQKQEITFSEFGKKWLELHAKAHCKTTTYERYEQIFRIHLAPRFGSRPIDRIDRHDLKRYVSELAISKRHGLGTLRNIVATVRAILSEAVEDGLIEGNPASRLGKYTFGNARKRDIDFLTRSEAAGFLLAARTHSPIRYTMFLTALRTGLRLGELIALHWEDIQFGENADEPNRFISGPQKLLPRRIHDTQESQVAASRYESRSSARPLGATGRNGDKSFRDGRGVCSAISVSVGDGWAIGWDQCLPP